MKKIIFCIVMYFLFIFNVYAVGLQGCCSHHDGVNYCSSSGRVVCNDGTYSPSCRCDSYTNSKYSSNYNYSSYSNSSYDYEEESDDYSNTLIVILFLGFYGWIGYFLLKK